MMLQDPANLVKLPALPDLELPLPVPRRTILSIFILFSQFDIMNLILFAYFYIPVV